MDHEQTSERPGYFWWLLPLLVLICGLVLTVLIAPRSQVPVGVLTDELSRAHHDRLSGALADQTSGVLGTAGNLSATGPGDFSRQATAFLAQHPEVAALELLTTVSQARRERVERRLSEQAGEPIRFYRWTGSTESEPAEGAGQYLVVRHVAFQPGTGAAALSLGLVVTSVPHWREALRTAWEEDRPTATSMTGLHRNGDELRAVRVFIPVRDEDKATDNRQLVSLVIRPHPWLNLGLAGVHDARWQVEIHDISQHARQPLASLPSSTAPASDVPATRSTLTLASRQWMLSTRPSGQWLDGLRQQALWPAWLTGLAVTLAATVLTTWASWRMAHLKRQLQRRTRRTRRLGQQLDNTRVEKNILHNSLQASERRTRDLIELGTGMFAELDEGRHIGYISPQTATLLDVPSTELVGTPLDALFSEHDQGDLAMAFDAARRDHGIQRLDTEVTTRDGERFPVALLVKMLQDPVSGCAGFRVSLTPRQ